MTPQTQFTPGPWSLDTHGRFFSILDQNGEDVCAFPDHDGKPPTEEQKANAALIAAAPSLYAALKAILDSRPEIAGFGQDEFRDAINHAEILIRSLDLGSSASC